MEFQLLQSTELSLEGKETNLYSCRLGTKLFLHFKSCITYYYFSIFPNSILNIKYKQPFVLTDIFTASVEIKIYIFIIITIVAVAIKNNAFITQ